MRTGIVIQARIGSSRLPGKVLKPLAGATMLSRIIRRARRAEQPDALVVAVPYAASDDPVADEARATGAHVVRGSEDDVLARFVQAIQRHGLDVVVRLTADNPFVEGAVIDDVLRRREANDLDYVHNVRDAGYPLGTCVEVARASALCEAFAQSDRRSDHEHVTPYLYDADTNYRTGVHRRDDPVDNLRLTVDTEPDYRLAAWIYDRMDARPHTFGLDDVLQLRAEHPEKFEVNASVQQKSISE